MGGAGAANQARRRRESTRHEDRDGANQVLVPLLRRQHADGAERRLLGVEPEPLASTGAGGFVGSEALGPDRGVDRDEPRAERAGGRVQVGERLAPGRDGVGGADDVGHRHTDERPRGAAVEDLPDDPDVVSPPGRERRLRIGGTVDLDDVDAALADQLRERTDLGVRADRQAHIGPRVARRPQTGERHCQRLDAGVAQPPRRLAALLGEYDERLGAERAQTGGERRRLIVGAAPGWAVDDREQLQRCGRPPDAPPGSSSPPPRIENWATPSPIRNQAIITSRFSMKKPA